MNYIINNLYTDKKYTKSPLRYPGGKSRAVKIILSLIPNSIDKLISPFFGGGSVELAVSSFGIDVLGFDIFNPLVDFWYNLIYNRDSLIDKIEEYYPINKDLFYYLKNTIKNSDDSGALFFVLNRSSFSGSTLNGGFSGVRFTNKSIDNLRDIDLGNLYVDRKDFKDTFNYFSGEFFYVDPPYYNIKNLYGYRNIDQDLNHEDLFNLLSKENNWILSYNNVPEIVDMYSNYRILYPNWKYGMTNDKNSKEILVLSNNIPDVY
jgi:DNA adenine methylase